MSVATDFERRIEFTRIDDFPEQVVIGRKREPMRAAMAWLGGSPAIVYTQKANRAEVLELVSRALDLFEGQRPGESLKPTEKFVPKVEEKTAGGTT
ncbi:MAG: hypothetical protein IH884_06830 [Myxococcales bacterium]|nr:hypothetical protein [Myxococcales bacterium]